MLQILQIFVINSKNSIFLQKCMKCRIIDSIFIEALTSEALRTHGSSRIPNFECKESLPLCHSSIVLAALGGTVQVFSACSL